MARIVLVHGAWQGPWCWDLVAPRLTGDGHDVARPCLTGSGPRAAELTPAVDLRTHVADVVRAVEAEATPCTLVAHSYSGMLVPDVVARCPELVSAVVLVDAFLPDAGASAIDQMPAPFPDVFRQRARDEGDGWRLPASDGLLDVWGLHDPDLRRWVRERLTDWSLPCFESASEAPRQVLREVPRWFAVGTGDHPVGAAFQPIAEAARADGWTVVPFDTGHDVMLEAPDALAGVVLDAAGAA